MSLANVVTEAVDSLRHAAEAKRLAVALVIKADVEPVSADPLRLEQVVWNLVANAVKFTPALGRIEVAVKRHDDVAVIEVSDTGQGIPPEFLPHVFDRFRQADASTTRTHGGLGLGLAIVRELVELHGGTVTVSSPGLGLGATFTVTLPVVATSTQAAAAAMDQTRSPTLVNHSPDILNGKSLLVVDDHEDMREFLARLLTTYGCHVIHFASAQAGLDYLSEHTVNLVLADIAMPGEDGYAFLERVQTLEIERGISIPVVAVTAFAGKADEERVLAAGFAGHLGKPVDMATLHEVVSRVLRATALTSPSDKFDAARGAV